MIDLHTHILPGLDDGPGELPKALKMARAAVADGIRTMVATPHCGDGAYDTAPDTVHRAVEVLNHALQQNGIRLTVLPGAEVRLGGDDPVGLLKAGRLMTLNDTGRYLLVELPPLDWHPQIVDQLYRLRLTGVTPVLAHAERIIPFQERPERIADLVHSGTAVQITAASLLGAFGPAAKKLAIRLLKHGRVHAMASDAHSVRRRPPLLSAGVQAAARIVGRTRAMALVVELPAAMVDGRPLPVVNPPAEDTTSPPGLWRRWFAATRG